MSRSFPIAPMSPLLRWLTIAVLALPVLFVGLGVAAPDGAALALRQPG
ncbi:MAG: hypothetical protein P8R42_20140 [Candidatus Binatia bacterium]|nr:hypothetical protein [Candidatus Binatia bacterium]